MSVEMELQYGYTAELAGLFERGLRDCDLKPGEKVCLFTDTATNPHYSAGFLGAAKALGAYVYEVKVPSMPEILGRGAGDVPLERAEIPPGGPMAAMKSSDLVVNLATVRWLYTPETNEVLASGARILMVKDPPGVLRRLRFSKELKARGLAGAAAMSKASRIRLTNDAGTDLTFDKTGRNGKCQYSAADEPGRWDQWPSGSVSCAPLEGTAKGILVIGVGDVVLRVPRYLSEPVRCEFSEGRVVKMTGGVDALLIKEYMDKFHDEKAFIPAHVGWGTHKSAQWQMLAEETPGGHHDAEFYYGNILLGFGSNYTTMMGGKNVTKAHIDICMRNCSLWLDDRKVLDHGQILPEELR